MPERDRAALAGLLLAAGLEVFGDGLVTAILKGSAVKGDFVPGYSDFDMHLFLRSSVVPMVDGRTPALDRALAFQAAMGGLDPEAFGVSTIQVYFLDGPNYPSDRTPPIPGTYELVYGSLPPDLPQPQPDEIVTKARSFFPWARREAQAFIGRIADKPDSRLASYVRLFGTSVKPAVYHAAILRGEPPLEVWRRSVADVLPVVDPWCPSGSLDAFFAGVWRWSEVRHDPARLRALFRSGYCGLMEICDHAAALAGA